MSTPRWSTNNQMTITIKNNLIQQYGPNALMDQSLRNRCVINYVVDAVSQLERATPSPLSESVMEIWYWRLGRDINLELAMELGDENTRKLLAEANGNVRKAMDRAAETLSPVVSINVRYQLLIASCWELMLEEVKRKAWWADVGGKALVVVGAVIVAGLMYVGW